jgi:hypothetical protein
VAAPGARGEHNGAMPQLPGPAQETTTATLLAGYLHAAGVRHVFGYPGESIIDFMEAARHRGIEVVSAVREGTAAFMAEATAMVTGRPGVCLSTLGPGSTAVLNGVASATLDRVPVLAVSGQIESSREQFFTHQVVDHGRMFAPVSKLALRLDPASADTIIRKALRTAVAERPGAVHLTVTADAWPVLAEGEVSLPPLAPAAGSVDVHGDGDPVRTLTAARRPVILAGIAALRCAAGPELVRLAELAGIPVVVSPMAKGVFPEDHPYFAGVLEMAGYRVVWDLLAGADLILAAGFDPVELISPWSVATPGVRRARGDRGPAHPPRPAGDRPGRRRRVRDGRDRDADRLGPGPAGHRGGVRRQQPEPDRAAPAAHGLPAHRHPDRRHGPGRAGRGDGLRRHPRRHPQPPSRRPWMASAPAPAPSSSKPA